MPHRHEGLSVSSDTHTVWLGGGAGTGRSLSCPGSLDKGQTLGSVRGLCLRRKEQCNKAGRRMPPSGLYTHVPQAHPAVYIPQTCTKTPKTEGKKKKNTGSRNRLRQHTQTHMSSGPDKMPGWKWAQCPTPSQEPFGNW